MSLEIHEWGSGPVVLAAHGITANGAILAGPDGAAVVVAEHLLRAL